MNDMVDIKLDVPPAKLSELSFAAATVAAIDQWASDLPLVNTAETAAQLHKATAELADLEALPAAKFELLETLRPLVHYICARLDRAALAKGAQVSTMLAQGLLQNLTQGYKSALYVAVDNLAPADTSVVDKPSRDVLPKIIHRLISDLSRVELRALQFYLALPEQFWSNFNGVYQIAEQLQLTQYRLVDDENYSRRDLSVQEACLRALLMASSKPNQLLQPDLANVFNALELWAQQAVLDPRLTDAFLIIDFAGNHGPQYASLAKDLVDPRGLRTEVLAYELEAYLNDVSCSLPIPDTLRTELLQHLASAWSLVKPRAFRRLHTATDVRICVGLSASHYFLSGGVEFAEQLSNADAPLRREINPFLDVDFEPSRFEHDDDPWNHAHDLKTRIPENPNILAPERILMLAARSNETKRHYEHFDTRAIDTSPGGYQIRWYDPIPSNAKVGELVALREDADARWRVAVVRWIRQTLDHASMGVELLGPKAIPVAIRAIQKVGGPTDYARALLLPRMDAIGQPATLITPRVPFAARQKVHIQRQGIQTTGQLLDYRLKTQIFNQFTFRMLDGYLENTGTGSTIDSLSAMTREDTTQGP